MRDPVKAAFKAGFESGCSYGWYEPRPGLAEEAWTEYAAERLERIADDQDELDEPIPYRPTDVYVHATHEPDAA